MKPSGTRVAYWVTFAGLAVQLLGVSWDGRLHHADPHLAAREGLFTLSNPGHLLIAVGTGLALVGVGWGLVGLTSGEGRGWHRRAPGLAAAALVALSALTGSVAIATDGPSGHTGSVSHARHEIAPGDPVLAELKGVLHAGGVRRAVGWLDHMAADRPRVRRDEHHYLHELGALAYRHYGSAEAAFRHCDERLDSGCYHGVVIGYFREHPRLRRGEVERFCMGGVIHASSPEVLRFQCLHGLGHGLSTSLHHDTGRALSYCDRLPRPTDRTSCYGGAFMEEAMSGADSRKSVNARCAELQELHRESCYVGLSGLAVRRDPGRALKECEQSPELYTAACSQGVGGAMGLLAGWNPTRTRALCMRAGARARTDCFVGAVQGLLGRGQSTDRAFALCARAPSDVTRACLEVTATLLGRRYTRPASRARECAKAERPAWVRICRRAL